jgi:aminoglycoside 6'-N-acetyltransferase I
MNIRSIAIEDFIDWLTMASALWPEESEADLSKLFNELLSLEHYKAFIVRSDSGEAAAFIYLSLRSDYVEGSSTSPVGYIEGIYVKPAFRDQGVARKLAEIGEEWAREIGCSEMASDAYWDNTESREFHKHIGFAETERLVHFIKPIK